MGAAARLPQHNAAATFPARQGDQSDRGETSHDSAPAKSRGTFTGGAVSHLGMATTLAGPTRPGLGIAGSRRRRNRSTVRATPIDPHDHALLTSVTALLDEVARALGDADGHLTRLHATLSEPLAMAVAGHTSAGKSTLVNALIGHQIAPTAATECTRVITYYRFGPEHPQVICKDGTRHPLWFTTDARRQGLRQLPEQLPVPENTVEHLDVPLDFDKLHHLTVIDTPGLSGDEGLAGETEALLASGAADVLLFVLGGAEIRGSEHDALSAFRRNSRSRYSFPGNSIGVLSRADTYPGPDPMTNAAAVAATHSSELTGLLAGVVPIMGRIAATSQTGAFNQTHTDALQMIAALPAEQRTSMLRTAPRFLDSPTLSHEQLPRAQRVGLIERLAIHGIRALTEPALATAPTVGMYDTMRHMSGIELLSIRLHTLFVAPRAVHKTVRVLADIEKLANAAARGQTREMLLDHVDDIRHSPDMHGLNELRALTALYSGTAALGDPVTHDAALRLFEGTSPAQRLGCTQTDAGMLEQTARAAVNTWQAFANTALDSAAGDVARTAARSAHLIDQRLQRGQR